MRYSTTIPTAFAVLAAFSTNASAGPTRRQNDPQTSLTLDPKVIASGFANNGQVPPVAGQVASLTSTNNFINFCLTVPNLPITNGQQVQGGSCNPAPIGLIPSVDKMPSAKFTNPKNGDTIAATTAFTISMAINNLATGNFVNAQQNYFAAPQQLDGSGTIVGHSHVVVELLQSISQTTPTNPKQFAFFKGLNAAAQGGILTADVTGGLPAGAYRLCSINTAANHQPAIVPVAQHGSLDDCVYFTAAAGGAAAGAAAGGAAAGGVAAATTTAAAAAGTTTAAAGTGKAATTAAAAKGKAGKGKAGKGKATTIAAAAAGIATTTDVAAAAGIATTTDVAATGKATTTAVAATGIAVTTAAAGKATTTVAAATTTATTAAPAAATTKAATGSARGRGRQQGRRRLGARRD